MTVHVAQGLTVDRAFVLAGSGLNRELGYTALSRGRETNHLYAARNPKTVAAITRLSTRTASIRSPASPRSSPRARRPRWRSTRAAPRGTAPSTTRNKTTARPAPSAAPPRPRALAGSRIAGASSRRFVDEAQLEQRVQTLRRQQVEQHHGAPAISRRPHGRQPITRDGPPYRRASPRARGDPRPRSGTRAMSATKLPTGQAVPRLALTKAEAAEALGVSVDFFEDHIMCELRIVRRGRRRLIPVAELVRWLRAAPTARSRTRAPTRRASVRGTRRAARPPRARCPASGGRSGRA